jgi:hypothetical protein
MKGCRELLIDWRHGLKSTKRRATATWILWLLLLLAIGTVGSILYFFDPSSYGFYPTCLFHRTTGLLCPGCGSLRALHQMLHGHIWTAFRYNPTLVTSMPFLAVLAGLVSIAWFRDKPVTFAVPRKWLLLIIGIGLAFSIWRNIPGCPFSIPDAAGP